MQWKSRVASSGACLGIHGSARAINICEGTYLPISANNFSNLVFICGALLLVTKAQLLGSNQVLVKSWIPILAQNR